MAGDVVVFTGHTVHSDGTMRALAHESWQLGELDERYAEFVERFRPAHDALADDAVVLPKTAFLIRTLLIQEYRKILLRDPQMPDELLPNDWHGADAYRICRDLYRRLTKPCDAYLTATMQNVDGALPPPDREYRERFGGLGGKA